VFADATARDAAITSPAEGQYAFLKNSDTLTFYTDAWSTFTQGGSAGSVLQVVSVTKTDTFSASVSSVSFGANVTGLSASITPGATSSQILVSVSVHGMFSSNAPIMQGRMLRGSTPIGVGATAGSRTSVSGASGNSGTSSGATMGHLSLETLDSPATTSEITYNFQPFNTFGSSSTVYINRTQADSDAAGAMRAASTITLMEVAG